MTTIHQRAVQPADGGLQQLLAGLSAVRSGDFSTRLPTDGDPLMDEIASVFNGMNEQLALFTSEVTRVSWSFIPLNTEAISSMSGSPAAGRRVLKSPLRTADRPASNCCSPLSAGWTVRWWIVVISDRLQGQPRARAGNGRPTRAK